MLSLTSNSSYTHPGWNDVVNVEVWLPLDDWNGYLAALAPAGLPDFMLTYNTVDSRAPVVEAIKQALAHQLLY
jgi:hypothetical protein